MHPIKLVSLSEVIYRVKLISSAEPMSRLLLFCLISTTLWCNAENLELKATPRTIVWGYYSASAKPVLTIHSGDTVRVETVSGNPARLEAAGMPAQEDSGSAPGYLPGRHRQRSGRPYSHGSDLRGRRGAGRCSGAADFEDRAHVAVRVQRFSAGFRVSSRRFSVRSDENNSTGPQPHAGTFQRFGGNSAAAVFWKYGRGAAGSERADQ